MKPRWIRAVQALAASGALAARMNGCGGGSSTCYCPAGPGEDAASAGTMSLPDGAWTLFVVRPTSECTSTDVGNVCRLITSGSGPLWPPELG